MNIDLNTFIKELYKKANNQDIEIEIAFNMFLEQQKTLNSITTYKKNIYHCRLIIEYFKKQNIKYISQLDINQLYKYINFHKNKGNSNTYINKHILLIKQVYKTLIKAEIIEQNPFKDFKSLKETKPQIKIIEDSDILRIYNYLKNISLRNELIILLLLETGIRRTELSLIRTKNIDFINKSIYLEDTKNKKPGYIYPSNETFNKLNEYLKGKPSTYYLFNDTKNDLKPISVNTISNIVARIKKALNISNLSPHKFRHTYATSIISQTNDLEITRQLLRHETYDMTKRYVHIKEKP